VRFVEAYRAAGVPIWAITPQNEPEQPAADYPGMFMTAPEEAVFVHRYLAPALRAAGLRTRVYGYDYVWAASEPYSSALLADDSSDLAGIAYHCYFGAPESMDAIHAAFPRADLIEDECSTGISVLSPIQVLLRSVDNWASLALMWNVALDPSGGPKIGSGCLNCIGMITVDPSRGSISSNGPFWQFAQAAAFVPDGARRIGASASPAQPRCASSPVCGLEYSAFSDPGGDRVAVVTNSGPQPLTFAVRRRDGGAFTYTLPGQTAPNGTDDSRDASVVTFVWGPGVS
jgi:glucosylceramidase